MIIRPKSNFFLCVFALLDKGWARAKFFQGSDEFMSKVSAGIAAEILLEQMPPLKNSPVVMRDLLYIL